MTEEAKAEIVKDVKAEVPEVSEKVEKAEVAKEEHQETEVEAKAREMGWNPDKEGVDQGKWIGAEEYIARAPLFEKNRKLSRKVKELESSVNALKGHYTKIEGIAYEKALLTLKEQKIKAMEEFDHKKVAELDEEIVDMKAKSPKTEPRGKNEPLPEFEVWRETNEWYDKDEDLKEYADFVGVRHAAKNEGIEPEDLYKFVEKKVRERFPEKFSNKNKTQQSPVAGVSKAQSKPGRPTWGSLPEHFQRAGDKFVRNGIMTRDQYIDDLIKLGEVK